MIKAIFFDLDGTLLSHTNMTIPHSTLDALEQLKQAGIYVFLATGRHARELRQLSVDCTQFEGMATMNGQLCMNRAGDVVFEAPIRGADLEAVVGAFQNRTLPMILAEKDTMYINFVNDDVRRAHQAIATPIPAVGTYTGNKLYQAMVYGRHPEIDAFSAQLQESTVSWWNEAGVDVIDNRGGKVAGIRHFMQAYGVRREETMAFGDGQNDMDMLRFAGVGVAMGNAAREVKDCADFVTEHIDCDGVAKALAHFGLIK